MMMPAPVVALDDDPCACRCSCVLSTWKRDTHRVHVSVCPSESVGVVDVCRSVYVCGCLSIRKERQRGCCYVSHVRACGSAGVWI
jgi:hypothetical protein